MKMLTKKSILFIVLLCSAMWVRAHQPDMSTTMLVEQENGVWVLQISASLTAFQQEVKIHFADTPYKTPEEFQSMVLEHVKNTLSLRVNGVDKVSFSRGIVKLGHETRVIFEVFGISEDLQKIDIINNVFKDVFKSQSALVISKNGFDKKQFVLNNENEHSINLLVEKNSFVNAKMEDSETVGNLFKAGAITLSIVVFIGLLLFRYDSKKHKILSALLN
ncbi:DUF6702 family protein [Patiriisocius marinus]|uniref:DUF6702 family protein n=1 Tax=Patiriisocius marinus TaxID=1397112 RepID=UPI00232CD160|nr:DUF6702 family protein [Patiriisocius marinus]